MEKKQHVARQVLNFPTAKQDVGVGKGSELYAQLISCVLGRFPLDKGGEGN